MNITKLQNFTEYYLNIIGYIYTHFGSWECKFIGISLTVQMNMGSIERYSVGICVSSGVAIPKQDYGLPVAMVYNKLFYSYVAFVVVQDKFFVGFRRIQLPCPSNRTGTGLCRLQTLFVMPSQLHIQFEIMP